MNKKQREQLEKFKGELTMGELEILREDKNLSPLIRRCVVTIDKLCAEQRRLRTRED